MCKPYRIAAPIATATVAALDVPSPVMARGGLQLTFSNHRIAVALRLRRLSEDSDSAPAVQPDSQAELAAGAAVAGLSSSPTYTSSLSSTCPSGTNHSMDDPHRRSASPSILSSILAPIHSSPFPDIFSASAYLFPPLQTAGSAVLPPALADAPASADGKEPISLPSSPLLSSSRSISILLFILAIIFVFLLFIICITFIIIIFIVLYLCPSRLTRL